MDGKMLARLLAVIFIAFAVTAAAIDMARKNEPQPPRPISTTNPVAPVNPLRQTLERCQKMGDASGEDADCLAAWDENRRRFLGQDGDR
ncbi:conjugal transfer protein TrbK [Georhizobium profundi]|jgi:conjugative transfer region protein TrbK|uniref:Conjugal transfer protein TrbK n=1 Tax=Georhizobium profundi TaxID=2341112 RepID=A0A3Q8XQF0_9HYPH|nr:putative entry exclusion protein TrbK-alt [Georhizobium profundi]AZN71469.1 conjugal transfer protein TrbK [Georhizobium profundi]